MALGIVNRTVQSFLDEIGELPDYFGIAPIGLETRGHCGDTPLHVAAIRRDVEMVAALLDAGAAIDARGERDYTALLEAISQNHLEVVRLLLARGAGTALANDDGQTPLDLAELTKQNEIQSLLRAPAI
jgi:ankyrin repeat protein